MTKRLFYAAMTCCMVICSAAFVACSDDDDSGSGTNGGSEVATEIYQDGVEGVMNYFYETDAKGNNILIKGVALNKEKPDELSMIVADEGAAYGQFYAMISNVDSTAIVTHADGSITATLTDTLGNEKGTAEFLIDGKNGVFATVVFSEGLIAGVSKVDFITENAVQAENGPFEWLDSIINYYVSTSKVESEHYKGRVIKVKAPEVYSKFWKYDAFYKSDLYFRPIRFNIEKGYYKEVNMVCCNTPTRYTPAYYVYFDTELCDVFYCADRFYDYIYNYWVYDFTSQEYVDGYYKLPSTTLTADFMKHFGLEKNDDPSEGILRTKKEASNNWIDLYTTLAMNGVFMKNLSIYYINGFYEKYPPGFGQQIYYYAFQSYDEGSYITTKKNGGEYPYMLIKRARWDTKWDEEANDFVLK